MKPPAVLRDATRIAREAQRHRDPEPVSPGILRLRARVRRFHGKAEPRCVVLTRRHARCRREPIGGATGLVCWQHNDGLVALLCGTWQPRAVAALFEDGAA